MKRVLVAAMHHESNSFNPIVAGEKDFMVMRGAEFFENFRPNDSLSGVCQTLMAARNNRNGKGSKCRKTT